MTNTETAVLVVALLGAVALVRMAAFAVRFARDQHRYRLPKPPPVPRWREIDAAEVVEAWDRHYAETSG